MSSLINGDASETVAADDTAEPVEPELQHSGDVAALTFGPLSIDTSAFARCFKLRQASTHAQAVDRGSFHV